jgi:hypothetical protein
MIWLRGSYHGPSIIPPIIPAGAYAGIGGCGGSNGSGSVFISIGENLYGSLLRFRVRRLLGVRVPGVTDDGRRAMQTHPRAHSGEMRSRPAAEFQVRRGLPKISGRIGG